MGPFSVVLQIQTEHLQLRSICFVIYQVSSHCTTELWISFSRDFFHIFAPNTRRTWLDSHNATISIMEIFWWEKIPQKMIHFVTTGIPHPKKYHVFLFFFPFFDYSNSIFLCECCFIWHIHLANKMDRVFRFGLHNSLTLEMGKLTHSTRQRRSLLNFQPGNDSRLWEPKNKV